jgi:L-rhamnose-H+ transport protein
MANGLFSAILYGPNALDPQFFRSPMTDATLGFLLLLCAGAMNGSFTLPMKFTKRWAWENTWLAWTIFALVIFPPLLTLLTVPAIRDVYAAAGLGMALLVAAFGAGWGISQVFFGLAVEAVGIALAFSVILGISAAMGSLPALIIKHPDKIATPAGLAIIAGVVLVLVGVGICAVAGRRRERVLAVGMTAAAAAGAGTGTTTTTTTTKAKPSVARGLLFCTFSGLGSALVGLGLEFGKPLQTAAQHAGASQMWAPNAVWLPLMLAGGIPNLIYCIYLIKKNRTGDRFDLGGTAPYWLLAAFMALFWFGSTVMYGASTTVLGSLGAVLAWPLFMSLIVITASVWGVVTGEWKGAGRQPLAIMSAGVGVLIVAIFVLAAASRSV